MKRFSKKDNSSNKIRKRKTRSEKFKESVLGKKNIIFVITWILILALAWIAWWRAYFSNPAQVVQKVMYSPDSQLTYSDPELYKSITQYLEGKNIRTLSYTKKQEFEDNILSRYEIIESLDVSKTDEEWTVFVDISFHQPLLWFSNSNKSWIVWGNTTYPINDWDTIQVNSYEVKLPEYTNDYEDLGGIFYHIHDQTLFDIIEQINDIIDPTGVEKITYQPGGKKLHIAYFGKLILFHLDKSIDSQLSKLLDIKQYYNNYSTVSKIDLWSSDDIIVK